MEKSYFKSPIGILEIVCKSDTLISLKIVDKIGTQEKKTNLIKNIKTQLEEFFAGKRTCFDIKINPKGTEFQKKSLGRIIENPIR